MSIMAKKLTVLDLRAELGLDQQEIADEAHVSQQTISRIERGEIIVERTAKQVFYAINRLRTQRGWSEIAFNDIDWPLKE